MVNKCKCGGALMYCEEQIFTAERRLLRNGKLSKKEWKSPALSTSNCWFRCSQCGKTYGWREGFGDESVDELDINMI